MRRSMSPCRIGCMPRPCVPDISVPGRGCISAPRHKGWGCVSGVWRQPSSDISRPGRSAPCGYTTGPWRCCSACRRGRGADPPHSSLRASMWRGGTARDGALSGRAALRSLSRREAMRPRLPGGWDVSRPARRAMSSPCAPP